MLRYLISLALLTFVSSGCTESAAPSLEAVTLTSDKPSYSVGDTMIFTLRNGASYEIGFNVCMTEQITHAGTGTRLVPDSADCSAQLDILGPGQSTTYHRVVTSAWMPGRYLVSVGYEPDSQRQHRVVSATFEVE